ncbi:copper chaperone PCu(A)C [Phenylobacterium sp.]|uniref:copper chaperone PCu(A)C n=1 Tax=Phenylobacterium sp. TaxID=1871053 RepID=UPI00391892D3
MRFAVPLIAAALAASATAAVAAPQVSPRATLAWSRPAVAGSTGAGFMTLANPGKAADALVAAESPAARTTEIHRSSMAAGGVMKMEKQAQVAIPAGGTVVFAPGGYHLMFIGLTRTLKAGDKIPATLTFASGARVKAEFEVRVTPPTGGNHH